MTVQSKMADAELWYYFEGSGPRGVNEYYLQEILPWKEKGSRYHFFFWLKKYGILLNRYNV